MCFFLLVLFRVSVFRGRSNELVPVFTCFSSEVNYNYYVPLHFYSKKQKKIYLLDLFTSYQGIIIDYFINNFFKQKTILLLKNVFILWCFLMIFIRKQTFVIVLYGYSYSSIKDIKTFKLSNIMKYFLSILIIHYKINTKLIPEKFLTFCRSFFFLFFKNIQLR